MSLDKQQQQLQLQLDLQWQCANPLHCKLIHTDCTDHCYCCCINTPNYYYYTTITTTIADDNVGQQDISELFSLADQALFSSLQNEQSSRPPSSTSCQINTALQSSSSPLQFSLIPLFGCLGGAVVMASDFWSGGLQFDSPSARYQAPRSTQPSIPPGSVNRVPAFTGWG